MAENAYFEAMMAPNGGRVETLCQEIKGRIKADDRSLPVKYGDWLYWWAFEQGAQYRKWYRKGVSGGVDRLIFDEPAEAGGKDYFRLGAIEISPDGRYAATMADDDGSERYKHRNRDLETGADAETVTEAGIGSPDWSANSRGLVFTTGNAHQRSHRPRFPPLG